VEADTRVDLLVQISQTLRRRSTRRRC